MLVNVFSNTKLKERLRKKAAIQENKDEEFGDECSQSIINEENHAFIIEWRLNCSDNQYL
jgi:hypothetical protein